jgi:DNA modification methylase
MEFIKEQIGPHEIYLGDCLQILPILAKVDAIVSDPPYGVGEKYVSYVDSAFNLVNLARQVMPLLKQKANRILLTTGTKQHRIWPDPDWVMAWVEPAGTGCGPWGFSCWQPIFCYGKDPFLQMGLGSRPDIYIGNGEKASTKEHPCAKPISFMRWLVIRATAVVNSIVLDPFMGSGTTGVACIQTGRRFIGIEIEPKYFNIARHRLIEEQAREAKRMFTQPITEARGKRQGFF